MLLGFQRSAELSVGRLLLDLGGGRKLKSIVSAIRLAIIVSLAALLVVAPLGFLVPIISAATSPVALGVSPTVLSTLMNTPNGNINLIVETTSGDYGGVQAFVNRVGGEISIEYSYINAVALSIPNPEVLNLAALPSVSNVYLDEYRMGPADYFGSGRGANLAEGDLDSVLFTMTEAAGPVDIIPLSEEMIAEFEPTAFINRELLSVTPDVLAETDGGSETIIGYLDTGFIPNPFIPSTRIIGPGVDVSPDVGGPDEGAIGVQNHPHGTFGSVLAAGGTFGLLFPAADPLITSFERNTGSTLPPFGPFKILPFEGIAPAASLFIVKIFPSSGLGIPTSIVLDGLEAIIDAKLVDGIDIDVINQSFGGATLFDGRDLEDQLEAFIASIGIIIGSSAGNGGPNSITTSSPASAFDTIAVSAATDTVHTRLFWDVVFGGFFGDPTLGDKLYVDDLLKIQAFSSRGPTSDGRVRPTVSATGTFVFSSFGGFSIGWGSGTSFSHPQVTGVTALLNSWAELNGFEPTQLEIKESLINTADPMPVFRTVDQGAGFVNADAALDFLQESDFDLDPEDGNDDDLRPPNKAGGNKPRRSFDTSLTLGPGYSEEFVLKVDNHAEQIVVSLTDVVVGANPDPLAQALFPNSIELYINSGIRTIGPDIINSLNIFGDVTFVLDHEDLVLTPGFWRVTVEGDWTNAVPVSADVHIEVIRGDGDNLDDEFTEAEIVDGEVQFFTVDIPAGVDSVLFQMEWEQDWSAYPTSDLDFILISPSGGLFFGGATLNSPERVVVGDPEAGTWLVIVVGFEIHVDDEEYEFFVLFDGEEIEGDGD